MEIRQLREADAPAWWTIRLEALEADPLAFGTSAEEHRRTDPADAARRFRDEREGDFHLGAFARERLAGIARFERARNNNERHKGWIFGVFVAAGDRRAGTGRALVAEAIARASRDPSLEQIELGVATVQRAAVALYTDLGFTLYGTEPRALKIGGTYVDEALMVLRLR